MDGAKLRELLPGVPIIESPFFDEVIASSNFDAETVRVARELNEKGFATLRFPDEDFEVRAARIVHNLASRFDLASWRRGNWRDGGLRAQDAWSFDDDVRALAANQKIIKILGDVFGRKAWPFQTLNFPVGSQQHFHSDSLHFSSIPERFMCGVWVALEDVSEDAGPLEYYPGSHKWPIIHNDQIGVRVSGPKGRAMPERYSQVWAALIEKHGIAPHYFSPRRGDTLIWAANLLHGGSRQRDPNVTRWSQVTHYFFENCCYFTPVYSDTFIGKLRLRDLVDIATGAKVPNIYIDTNLTKLDISYRFARTFRTLQSGAGRWVRDQLRRWQS